MKVTIKTLKNEKFEVEAEVTDTVRTLKEKIGQVRPDLPADSIKLIHSGAILENDAKTVGECNFKPSDYLVAVQLKAKAGAPVAAAAPAPAAAQSSAPVPATASSVSAPVQSQAPPASSDEPTLTPPEAVITQIMEMGFNRQQVVAALQASFGNPSRAVEFLMNGTPLAPAAASSAAPARTSVPASRNPPPVSPAGAGAASPGTLSASSPLAFLLTNPNFANIRQVVQQNPELLPALLQQLGRTNPDLIQLINENRQDFYVVLNTPVGGEAHDGGGGGPAAGQIQVTREENEAIERLCAMGFEKSLVIQAYFACDKNENMAANYLLQHGNE